ncbi:ATP-binding cassette domain-containing protein [Oligoflexia bacterium]|nr:ATP-binding cassette domain-containing protein [Oligoflexia bacterium]
MIQILNLSKAYGTQVLLDDITFSINAGEKVGLVGRNGSGKTTLFRLILREEELDAGTIQVPSDYRVGYLSQHIHFSKNTVIEEACLALPSSEEGVDQTYRVETTLLGLGFAKEEFQTNPNILSGGYQVRLNLVKLLVSEPNLLLLDEPTNYLDIVSIRWLARFLRRWQHELLLITHDRDFMDRVTTHTIGIHRNKTRKITGSTLKLREQIAQDEEVHEQTRRNEAKKREHVEDFVRRFRAKASKASAVQSRIKALNRAGTLEHLQEIESLDFKFKSAPFTGKWLMEIEDLSFAYDRTAQPLISGLNIAIGQRDRIAVIGKNGKGKSTLLNLLAEELKPVSGTVTSSVNAKLAFFGQMNIERLDLEKTVEDEILGVHPDHNRTAARGVCGLMMFSGDHALKSVKVLSGGERSRVLLGKILVTPANLLLLDEPTNHLDLESTRALLHAANAFSGAVVLVTHSEMILREFATRLIVFDGGKATLFEGSYEDFLDRVGWQDEEEKDSTAQKNDRVESKRALRKKRAEVVTRRSKLLNPLNKKIHTLEETIVALEKQVQEESDLLIEASQDGFGDDAAKISRQLHQHKLQIENCFCELEVVTKERDLLAQTFEGELK